MKNDSGNLTVIIKGGHRTPPQLMIDEVVRGIKQMLAQTDANYVIYVQISQRPLAEIEKRVEE